MMSSMRRARHRHQSTRKRDGRRGHRASPNRHARGRQRGTSPAPIRVMCVENHRIVPEGIELIINQESDMKVVGACATGDEAVPLYRQCRPDVVLMDLRLGKTSGVDAIKAIRHDDPKARIVVLTMYEGDEDIFRAHQAGATTYLLKDTLSADLIRVVRAVHAGERPVLPEVH